MYIKKNLRKVSFLKNQDSDKKRYSQEAYERHSKLKLYKRLKEESCTDAVIFSVLAVPRSTLYRWKKRYNEFGLEGLENGCRIPDKVPEVKYTPDQVRLVLKVRRENPLWGKYKIVVIIERDYRMKISVSTVGRIIKMLVKKGLVKPVKYYFGRLKDKRPRKFNNHAKRWKYDMKPCLPGEMIQVDHAVVEAAPERYVKQFDATCPVTKLTVSQVYHHATSRNAAQFLEYMQEQFPFKIVSIQVDGGSEFMGQFEELCQKQKIKLFVLPPRSPKLNGNVERRHATIKYEFFSTYDGPPELAQIRTELTQFIDRYNRYRPHQALDYDTPWDFYLKLEA